MSNDEEKRNTFKISYHRDFTSLSNENTDRYIDESNSNNSVTYIEVDVRLTKDGRIIVAHSNDLIVDGKHVRISDLNYEEARNLSISDRNKLINVREAAFLFNGGVIITPRFDGDYLPLCNELIRELVPIKNNLNIIIQSTSVEVLSYIRRFFYSQFGQVPGLLSIKDVFAGNGDIYVLFYDHGILYGITQYLKHMASDIFVDHHFVHRPRAV